MTRITLARIGKNETVRFAVEELIKYLKAVDVELILDVRLYDAYDPKVKNVIWVGEDAAFADKIPAVENAFLDDAIYVNVKNGEGVITGTNPRSVLIAAYRFLKNLGVAWIRPTDDGEVIPQYTLTTPAFDLFICEAASYRHRAICIEGCDTYENVERVIEWIPRQGMSGYFFQFEHPITFFEKWYNHICNVRWPNEHVNKDDIIHMTSSLEEEIAKRGLLLHYYGHGFTTGPLGFIADSWNGQDDKDIPDDKRKFLAQVNGKRGFFNNMPMCTNLCFSNPEARGFMTKEALRYAKTHPDVHYLHFWLSDGANNVCECENCTEQVADYYVTMLNELDAMLTAEGLDTKIVFLIYSDLKWPPLKEHFVNPDRFVLMLCAGGELENNYKKIDPTKDYTDHIPPYVKNAIRGPKGIEGSVGCLQAWRKQLGDSFDSFNYAYHMCYFSCKDFGFYALSKLISDDIKCLKGLGIGGMVSCQMSRTCMPCNQTMQIMADTLWDMDADFEVQSAKYFREAYGLDGAAVMEFLREVAEHLEYCKDFDNDRLISNYGDLIRLIYEFDIVLERNLANTAHLPAVKKSWEIFVHYRKLLLFYVEALYAKAEGDEEKKIALCREGVRYLQNNEGRIYKTLEFWTYYALLKRECGYKEAALKTAGQMEIF